MSSSGSLNPESETFENRPAFYIGQHDSARFDVLTDDQYTQVLNSGVSPTAACTAFGSMLTGNSFASSQRLSRTSISSTVSWPCIGATSRRGSNGLNSGPS